MWPRARCRWSPEREQRIREAVPGLQHLLRDRLVVEPAIGAELPAVHCLGFDLLPRLDVAAELGKVAEFDIVLRQATDGHLVIALRPQGHPCPHRSTEGESWTRTTG